MWRVFRAVRAAAEHAARGSTSMQLVHYSVTPIMAANRLQHTAAAAETALKKSVSATVNATSTLQSTKSADGVVPGQSELDVCCATLPTVDLDPRVVQMAQGMRADAREACGASPGLSEAKLVQHVYDSLCAAAESFYDDGHPDRAFITYMAALMEADAAEKLLPTGQRVRTASAANNVGVLLMHSGQNNDAAAAYLQLAHGIQEAAFGRTHASTLKSASHLATLLAQMGKLEHAVELYIDILKDFKATVGEQSTEYGETLLKMAVTYTHAPAGAVEQKEIHSLFQQALTILSATASDKVFLASAVVQHALWLATLGGDSIPTSESNMQTALRIVEESEGNRSGHLAPILLEYAQLLVDWRRHDEASVQIDRARHIVQGCASPLSNGKALEERLHALTQQVTLR